MVAANEDDKQEEKPKQSKSGIEEFSGVLSKLVTPPDRVVPTAGSKNPLGLDDDEQLCLLERLAKVGKLLARVFEEVQKMDRDCERIEMKQGRDERILGLDRSSLRSLATVALTLVHRGMCTVDPVACKSRDLPTGHD